jgi:hypothetical protein
MLRTVIITAALVLAAGGAANGQTIDKNGKCHDAKGHFAKMDVCKGAGKVTPAAGGPATGYKLDAKGQCHDAKGKMAKKELCKA